MTDEREKACDVKGARHKSRKSNKERNRDGGRDRKRRSEITALLSARVSVARLQSIDEWV